MGYTGGGGGGHLFEFVFIVYIVYHDRGFYFQIRGDWAIILEYGFKVSNIFVQAGEKLAQFCTKARESVLCELLTTKFWYLIMLGVHNQSP